MVRPEQAIKVKCKYQTLTTVLHIEIGQIPNLPGILNSLGVCLDEVIGKF